MTEPVTFFSYLVSGLLANDGQLPVDGNLEATFQLSVTSGPSVGQNPPVSRTVGFYRPCDVIGINADAVRRTDPSFKVYNSEYEPNYLPLVEFVEADLPWRFSSDPGSEGHRTPWVSLVVLAADEFKLLPPSSDRVEDATGKEVVRPATVEVLDAAALPPPRQAGLWAHVQADGEWVNATDDQLAGLNKASPFGLISRLVAARRLAPRTTYTAFVVPTYECGRLRGLDPEAPHEHSTALAWENAAAGHELPVYFSWSFSTSAYGDIEALAERLEGRGLDPDTGTRPLQSAQQEYNVPEASPHRRYEGAIFSTEVPPHDPQNPDITNRLVEVLNWPSDLRQAAGGGDPLSDPKALAPPIYGSWHGRRHRVTTGDTDWVDRLNTQIHLRAVAGLGAEVVRRDQEDLMAEAWRQIGDVMEAARRLCAAQFGYLASSRLFERSVGRLSPEALLFMTRPVHAKLRNAGITTLAQQLEATNLRGVTKSARLRSMLRPNSVAERYLRPGLEDAPRDPLSNVVRTVAAAETITRPFEKEIVDPALAAVAAEEPPPAGGAGAGPIAGVGGGTFTTPIDGGGGAGGGFGPGPEDIIAELGLIGTQPGATQPVDEFGPLDIGDIQNEILGALEPAVTIPNRINALIAGIEIPSPQALCDAVMPAPEFTTPMYEPLREMSVSYLMPGIGDVPANTVSLLQTNPEFIEAYMAGLNFEMAAELLWRGYPTEMRATFFKHFWETGGQGPDVSDLAGWNEPLGENIVGGPPPLVLLIRGDILRRYPGILIYARQAEQVAGQYNLAGDAVLPVFRADLTPDTVAIGFELSEQAVRGDAANPDGYFFILEERERNVRLGFDEPEGDLPGGSGWNEVTWDDVTPASYAGAEPWAGPVDLSLQTHRPNLPTDPEWGGAAAGMAQLLYQQPFRIALHARRLLPPDTQP